MAPAVIAEQLPDQTESHKTASCFTVGKKPTEEFGTSHSRKMGGKKRETRR